MSETIGNTEATPAHAAKATQSRLGRATFGMAVGTALSRLTGMARLVALAYALGFTRLTDSYNLANTTPNMLYDIVLGGVLSATFIPVFVERLATRSDREAWRSISAVATLAVTVMLAATIVFWFAAPLVIDAFTAFGHTRSLSGPALASERATATTLLRWFVPQIAAYGLFGLATALLNTRQRFGMPMWVPIANNLVCIIVLLWFRAVAPHPSIAGARSDGAELVLLGLGTTIGVVVQAALLLPSLARAGLGRLRWRWDPRNEAVRTMLRLGAWTFGFVVANQIALYVVLALAVGAPGPAPVSSYTYAYTFMLMPFAIVAVSVMSAVTPDLARTWATGDTPAFLRRLSSGLRAVLAVILPAAVGMFLLAKPASALLLGHGAASGAGETSATGAALAVFAIGLPGFCIFLYVVRVLQAMQHAHTAFWLYIVENGLNILTALILVHVLGVQGLALSLTLAYSIAAVCGLVVLRRRFGRLGTDGTWAPLRRVAVASAVMGVLVLVVVNLSGATHGVALLARVLGAVVVGIAAFAGTAALLARRSSGDHRRRRREERYTRMPRRW